MSNRKLEIGFSEVYLIRNDEGKLVPRATVEKEVYRPRGVLTSREYGLVISAGYGVPDFLGWRRTLVGPEVVADEAAELLRPEVSYAGLELVELWESVNLYIPGEQNV